MEVLHFSRETAIRFAFDAAGRNEALSWNLLMVADGRVASPSLDLLQHVGQAALPVSTTLSMRRSAEAL